MGSYTDELIAAISLLAQNEKVIFIGQGIKYPGHGMTRHFQHVQPDQLIELPVAEEFQLGISLGMALTGCVTVSVYPRYNFLLLAMDQLVNHLDKWNIITNNKSNPKVIIKVGVGSEKPLYPGPQHVGDFSSAFKLLCPNMEIAQLTETEMILPAYIKALERTDGINTILVEYASLYDHP